MTTTSNFIPVNEPLLDGNELGYVSECIKTGWISSEGSFVDRFEKGLAEFIGRCHGIAVANGTVALDLAVAVLGIGPGDEVILPTHTIISCAAAIVRAGAKPVVVDSDPTTWNMSVAAIESRITSRTRAIMAVHIFSLPVDMDPVLDLARKHNLYVIEDASQMIGQSYKNRRCGSFGDVSTFSFYPNKHITTGEGGMLLCNDGRLAERARSFRNLCFQPGRRFVHEELGWNFRISNLQAALGLAQLETLPSHLILKRKNGEYFRSALADVPGLDLPPLDQPYALNLYWVFGVMLQDEVPFDANGAMSRLAEKGIGTRSFFWPMHEQPVFIKMGLFGNEHHPFAERMARRGFYIPSGLGMTEEQRTRVVEAVRAVLMP
ncbi:MAG: DegT/DnrJ/EryC1/StrS family aminotransferase [Desulfobacterales bacterium]|nr:DegT/DnrJ/EryC1/StrS family aminotransferase [Desulfobacterales bacterium]